MKTEDLQGKGLNKEQIDFVMAEYGKDLNAIKAERDGYKTQLDTAQASLSVSADNCSSSCSFFHYRN